MFLYAGDVPSYDFVEFGLVYTPSYTGEGAPVKQSLNPYLVDDPDVLVEKGTTPLSPVVLPVFYGSKPASGTILIRTPAYQNLQMTLLR